MQIRIRVRPKQGYHYPFKIDELQIDSSARLETIQENYSTQGSTTRLYFGQYELPLNSSIGSHNFNDGAIIECCRSPNLAAALSACLKDLDEVKKLLPEDRCRENLMRILQTPIHVKSDPTHDIWKVESWGDDNIKCRTINFATMKAVIQRQDRYQVHDLPQCNDCQSLFDALQAHNVWSGGPATPGRKKSRWNQQAHIFKPEKKNGSGPTTNWILLDAKLEVQQQIKRGFGSDSTTHDYLEEFVRRDHLRHAATNTTNQARDDSESYLAHLASTPPRSATAATSRQSTPRTRTTPQPTSRTTNYNATTSTPKSHKYIPQYASAPFAVLATLHNAMHSKLQSMSGRRLTLTEDELKRLAQPVCRSNLYDKMRIRGRNAFACMDGLIEKNLVRKEIIRDPNSFHSEIEKWGLLPDGEVMGEYCAEFERAVRKVIPKEEIRSSATGKSMNVALCMDTREDVHYLERIRWSCKDENVPYLEKELPAGDYLFLEESLDEIVPVVIERKSWSDLADSCLGKGRARNRLDCVQLTTGSSLGMTCAGNCQLCKMKRCGCTQILFIIEGERCQGLRGNERCSVGNCCSACKCLSERHNVTQTDLEGVLNRLQLEHGCNIHYTKNFNETISSLFAIRTLLQRSVSFASRVLERVTGKSSLSYKLYKFNAQSRNQSDDYYQHTQLKTLHELDAQALISMVHNSKWDESMIKRLLGSDQPEQPAKRVKRNLKQPQETITLDDDTDESVVEVIKPAKRKQPEIISLDFDSDSVDDSVVEVTASNVDICDKSDHSIIILDGDVKPKASKKRKASQSSAHRKSCSQSNGLSKHSILILHRLNQYEAQFGKKLETIWREAYLDADGMTGGFYDKSLEYIKDAIDASPFPYVHGRTLATFSLWMQLIIGVQVRFVQGGDVASAIRHKLGSNGSNLTVASSAASTECLPAHQPTSSSQMNQWSNAEVYATPQKSNTSFYLTDPTKSQTISQSVQRPSSRNNAIREARLKRFERQGQDASFNALQRLSDSVHLSCPQCTLENELHAKKCVMCGFIFDSGNSTSDVQVLDDVPSGSTLNYPPNTNHLSGWSCPKCTLQNEASSMKCSVCGYGNGGVKRSRPQYNPDDLPWDCQKCSFENRMRDEKCFDCGYQNPDYINSMPDTLRHGTPGKKKVKCGACGNEGHNRSSATASNCAAYYDDEEVERREKIKQKKLAAIEEERQKIERLEREGEEAGRLHEEWLAKTEEMKRNNAQAEEYRNDALKRAKDKMKRLQKRNH